MIEKIAAALSPAKEKTLCLLGKNALKLEAAKPTILGAVGIACLVGGTVLACKATLKTQARVQYLYDTCSDIEESASTPVVNHKGELLAIDRKDIARRKTIEFALAGTDIFKNYVPAIALEALGIVCIIRSHSILNERIAALSAAYVTLENAYDSYRARVIEEEGVETDRKYRLGLRDEEVEIEGENGLTETEVIETYHAAMQPYTKYARYFDEFNSSEYRKSPEENFTFLRIKQTVCNEMLRRKGWLTLNEVYYELGFKPIPEGQLVGWLYETSEAGDQIDFGLWEARNADARDVLYGRATCFVLDFNVQGIIWDKI